MGGGGMYPYPKDVWSPSGGWWPHPRMWKRNTAIGSAMIFALMVPLWTWSNNNEERTPPRRAIPWRPDLKPESE
eukprot:CAMPEP_0198320124 /NCGR_PEP_ID=MMETSP1450-20131203/9118_1 /TAXON_ID=753684 ORGANISM="Madagascaria erythrocladiodes, Strain CCMP3234" /NCGR_SAMPLE_ID=MMETSP1450 /ASSEMBLY_ACC=CAM_ASM_001115 /LENGTH=73 /DNA_ID=CAMNT_0044023561 /DNA_START=113 /DNA_END=334 /DNA_ORIENTATION=+